MPEKNKSPEIPLPKGWGTHVKSAILHIIAPAQYALAYTRGWAANMRVHGGDVQRQPLRIANMGYTQRLPRKRFLRPTLPGAAPGSSSL